MARRHSLLRSFIQRVKITQPKIAVPSAGPCTVLDPDHLHLNSREHGIFIDPEEAVGSLANAQLPSQAVCMAASDVWDSVSGVDFRAPSSFRIPREQYIRMASERMAPVIRDRQAAEEPATADLTSLFINHFSELIAAQTPFVRRRINARLAFIVTGPYGGTWTLDFMSRGPDYVYEGIRGDWTYKIEVADKPRAQIFWCSLPFSYRPLRLFSRQDAKNAKFGIIFFLCGLCAFARDMPAFGCGFAALGSLFAFPFRLLTPYRSL